MSDFFFQIVLAAISIVIGISVPLLPTYKQKNIAKWVALITIVIAILWVGYELGVKESSKYSEPNPISSSPSTISAPATISESISRISAKADWQSSRIYVFKGNKVKVVTRNEQWSAYKDSSGNPVLTDANGRAISSYFSEFGLYAPLGSLIAKIGDGSPILIGKEGEFIVDMNGILYFRILDRNLDDNSGSITIQIEVQP